MVIPNFWKKSNKKFAEKEEGYQSLKRYLRKNKNIAAT